MGVWRLFVQIRALPCDGEHACEHLHPRGHVGGPLHCCSSCKKVPRDS
uniref:Uncharacterized protein n=1 Tax=Anguilla anguilla TaxID=7936 RepID=A0A0E9RUY5_ANGAN